MKIETMTTTTTTTTIEKLAQYISDLSIADLPDATLAIARQCLLDSLACAAAGFSHPAAAAARAWAAEVYPNGRATIWFGAGSYGLLGAAFANAFAASILDMDDGHRAASGHPGAAVVPAVLTVAAMNQVDFPTLLLAIACGYEAGLRSAQARDPARLLSVATGRWTAIAVAAGVGKLLQLPSAALAHALAIAEAQAPNLMAADHAGFAGSDTKEGVPWSVVTGIAAVEHARLGMQGYLRTLDNPVVYVPGAAAPAPTRSYMIDTTYFKRYGCCRWFHSAVDAILVFRASGLRAEEVVKIRIATFQRAVNLANERRPRDVISAQFSIPFCIAVAVVVGLEGLMPLDPRLLDDPDVLRLAERVEVQYDAELNQAFPVRVPARVTVWTAETQWIEEVHVPLGDPAHPMSHAQVIEKATTLAAPAGLRSPMEQLAPQLLALPQERSANDRELLEETLRFVGMAAA